MFGNWVCAFSFLIIYRQNITICCSWACANISFVLKNVSMNNLYYNYLSLYN